jgi:hypothetical protein
MLGLALGCFVVGVALAVVSAQDLRSGTVDGPFYGLLGVVGAVLALVLGVMVLRGRRRAPRS